MPVNSLAASAALLLVLACSDSGSPSASQGVDSENADSEQTKVALSPLEIAACHPPQQPEDFGPSSLDDLSAECARLPGIFRRNEPCEGSIVLSHSFAEECSFSWLFDAETRRFQATVEDCSSSSPVSCASSLPDFVVPAQCFDGSPHAFVQACPDTAPSDAGVNNAG